MNLSNKIKKTGVALGLISLLSACPGNDKSLNFRPPSNQDPVTMTYYFNKELGHYSAGDNLSREITVAYASDKDPSFPQPPFPVLYLLHDWKGNNSYYESYSLQDVISEMYKKGEIGRMLVVTVDASNYFDGSFYRNSTTSGNYDDLLEKTINHIERTFNVHSDRGSMARAIGGHGMGGYGAMRFALDHPDRFGAVSSICAPLSLGNPTQQTGIWDPNEGMIKKVFEENGTGQGDPSLYGKLKTGIARNETGQFFAMASAFSPHPLVVFDSLGWKCISIFPFIGRCEWTPNQEFYTALSAGPNTLSFQAPIDTFGVGVDVPLDSVGNVTESVWELWRDSADVKTVFQQKKQASGSLWNDVAIYFDAGLEDEHGHLKQNRDFDAALKTAGVPHTYEEYGDAGSLKGSHSDQLVLRLKRVIKFHSDHFSQPYGPGN